MDATVSARIPALIVRTLDELGGDGAALLDRHAIDAAVLTDPDARVPLASEQRMWEEAAVEVSDEAFGLSALARFEPGGFDVYDYAIRKSANLGAGLDAAARYNRLVHDVAEINLARHDEEAHITHHFRGVAQGATWHAALFTVASWLLVGRQLTGVDFPALRVGFQRPRPPNHDALAALFGAPIAYDQPQNLLVLRADDFDLPLVGADPALHAILARAAEQALARLPDIAEDRSLHAVRAALPDALRDGQASIDDMAARLKMSPRTLQRRLKDAGTSFKELVDDVRRQLATSLLEDERMGIADCAYLLGYSEPSAFQRAFKRWTGVSAGAWRAARA
jgi:AraC-like DNA-binding protein